MKLLQFIIKKPSEEISLKQNPKFTKHSHQVRHEEGGGEVEQEVVEQEQSEEESFAIYFLTSLKECCVPVVCVQG